MDGKKERPSPEVSDTAPRGFVPPNTPSKTVEFLRSQRGCCQRSRARELHSALKSDLAPGAGVDCDGALKLNRAVQLAPAPVVVMLPASVVGPASETVRVPSGLSEPTLPPKVTVLALILRLLPAAAEFTVLSRRPWR